MTDDRWNRPTAPAALEAIVPGKPSAFDPARERYEVGEELGRGGMGRVVAARDTTLDREVAIKQALDDDSAHLARFEREVRITARLEHPAIVPVHDAGRDHRGRPYYIMRRIDGEPLALRAARATSLRERLALVPNVLAAVDAAAFAHARRVVHGDIKPPNILVGTYGETLLIDWGLARSLDEEAGLRGGTAGYMSPEQARGEPTDTRGDVYALGATLRHVLAGGPEAPLPDGVPRELGTIIGKAMAEREARYADAGPLAADLRAFLAGQLVASHAYSTWERVRRALRRHRIAVATAAIALLALAIGGVIAIVNVVRERDAAAAARAVAADRAALMLLERASTLAPRDPTRAVALLRELEPASRYLPRARDIAAVAAANGIAHGKQTHRGAIQAIALDPTGTRLVTGGVDGTLQLHDLATGTSRTLATGAPVTAVVWTGDAITYRTDAGLERVQLATATHETLASGVTGFWQAGDKLRFVRGGLLVERDATEAVIAREVVDAVGVGETALVAGGGKLRLVDRNGERVLASGTVGAMALASDGTRAAAQVDDDIVEWEVATGTERARWRLATFWLVYGGQDLYHRPRGRMGALDRLVHGGAVEALPGMSSRMVTAETAAGTVVLGDDGTFAVLAHARAHRFALDPLPVRSVAGQRTSPVFAVGMSDGSFRWWDARTFMPVVLALPRAAMTCGFDAAHVYGLQGTDAFAIARADGVVRAIGDGMYRGCQVASGGVIAATLPGVPGRGPADAIDPATGAAAPLPGDAIVDDARDAIVYSADGKAIVEQRGGTPVLRGTAPAQVTFLSVADGWIAAALADGRVMIIDPRGATSFFEVGAPIEAVAMTASGTAYVARGHDVYRLAHAVTRLGTLASAIVELAAVGDADAAVLLRDSSIWRASAQGLVIRAEPATGPGATAFGSVRAAVTAEAGHTLVVRYLDTGVALARRMPDLVTRVQIAARDRETLAQLANPPVAALIYTEVVPADPAQLRAWLATATNALVAHDSDALTWR